MFSRTFNPTLPMCGAPGLGRDTMVHSVHEYYHTNQMVKPDNNMMQPSSVWAWGPYPVMVCLGEAWSCQSGTDHSLPLFTRLNHCLLRQEGRPLYYIICCCCCPMSATHLWLWQNGVCVFSDGQDSKSGNELKPNTWRMGPSLTNHCFSELSTSNALSSWKKQRPIQSQY